MFREKKSVIITLSATFAISNEMSKPEGPQPITTVFLPLNIIESL